MVETGRNLDDLWKMVENLNEEFFDNRIVVNAIEVDALDKGIRGLYDPDNKKIIIDSISLQTAPENEVEYIVYHEMCHQVITEHSFPFYFLLQRYVKQRELDRLGYTIWKKKRLAETLVDLICMTLIVSGFALILYLSGKDSLTLLCLVLGLSLISGGVALSVWFYSETDRILHKILNR